MTEQEYYASEFTDAEIDTLADAGERCLEESGFYFRLTQFEINALCSEGNFYLEGVFLRVTKDHETI